MRGGTAEIAAVCSGVKILPVAAGASDFARAVLEAAEGLAAAALPGDFKRDRMGERYRQLYPRAIARKCLRGEGRGIWLVANNFSTGGAQSSARRLLMQLHAQGVVVRAAVVQEQVENPTPGRQVLEGVGIRVVSVPPPAPLGEMDPAIAVGRLLEEMDADPPEAVIFWNLLTQYKVLLADLLAGTRVFDVSPGEMYFSSLKAYFAKPRPGLPYRDARQYGRRLAGMIVKYGREAEQAREVLGLQAERLHVIPNGVLVPSEMPLRRERGDGLVHLGTSCRLSPQKKLEELFAALRVAGGRMPAYRLHVAGGPDGDNEAYAAALREGAKDLPIEWHAEVSDIPGFLSGLDLFVMISEPAGCPNASMEAMAAGLAVVATDVGGVAEQVVDGVTGRLVPRADARSLADAMVDACGDRARMQQWGKNGWLRARETMRVEQMAAAYQQVLLCRGTAFGDRGGRLQCGGFVTPGAELPCVDADLR